MELRVRWSAWTWRRIASSAPTWLAAFDRIPRPRPFAWFLAWCGSLGACLATSAGVGLVSALAPAGYEPGGEWLHVLRFLAWGLQVLASSELLLALFDEELNGAKVRRGVRLAPAVGAFAAASVGASTWLATAALGGEAQPTVPVAALASAGTLAFVVALVAPLRRSLPAARSWSLSAYLGGWSLFAAGALGEGFAGDAGDGGRWPLAAAGAAAYAVLAGAVVANGFRRNAQRRARTQRNLLDSARKYRHVYYSAPVALMSVDRFGQILRWNDRAAVFFRNELRQGRVNTIGAVFGSERAAVLIRETTETGRHRCESTLRLDNGEAGSRTCAVEALLAADAIEISVVDITEQALLARTLEHMAYHDPLTERLNLRGIEREIAQVAQSVADGRAASLLYVGLDWFKPINDLFGHAIGNSVIVELSHRLGDALPADARIGRLGVDEFVAVLPGSDLARARALAQAVVPAIGERAFEIDGKRIRVGASAGVVEVAPGMAVAELIAYANAACDEARSNGNAAAAEPESPGEHLARFRAEVELGRRLRSSLPVERMSVYAQPIVGLRDESAAPILRSYEVLLRERDANGRIHAPTRLVAAAERHGSMCAIDLFMMERTLEHLSAHEAHAAVLDFVTVNLSGTSLNDERFLADAHALLNRFGAVAGKVCLEITESVALYDLRSTRRFVDRMRSLGVGIALDDFGAGHSSFAYLRELPASLVKLDGQFMPGIDRHPRNQVIVENIRRLCEGLGIACLAEWVEDVAALEFLLRIGMDHAQGYALARPLPIEQWLGEPLDLRPLAEARRRTARGGARNPIPQAIPT